MKKISTLLFFAACAPVVKAQFSIPTTYKPASGDQYKSYFVDTTNVAWGNTGTGQTWNYTNVVPMGPQDTVAYVTPASTGFSSTFPSANLANEHYGDYNFYSGTSSSLVWEGAEYSNGDNMILTNKATIITYPFTYNSSSTDGFSGTVYATAFSASGTVTGTVTVNGDATGTLQLPGGTYSNTLRVKTVTTMTISIPSFTITSVETRYSWYNNSQKFPVYEAGTLAVTSPFGTSTERFGQINSIAAVGMNENSANVSFNLFPNPANAELNVNIKSDNTENMDIEIFNQLGEQKFYKKISASDPDKKNLKINVSEFASGVYFVRVKTASFTKTEKIIVE